MQVFEKSSPCPCFTMITVKSFVRGCNNAVFKPEVFTLQVDRRLAVQVEEEMLLTINYGRLDNKERCSSFLIQSEKKAFLRKINSIAHYIELLVSDSV